LPAVPCLLILGSFEAIIIAWWAQITRYSHRISYRWWKFWSQTIYVWSWAVFLKCQIVRISRLSVARLKEFYCILVKILLLFHLPKRCQFFPNNQQEYAVCIQNIKSEGTSDFYTFCVDVSTHAFKFKNYDFLV
jgi:hypothetical protein